MSQLTFVSTTEKVEDMRADLGLPATAPAEGATPGATVIDATVPDGDSKPGDATPPQVASEPAAPADGAPAPKDGEPETPTPGQEYPETEGMTDAEFKALPAKTQRRIAKLTRRLRETEAKLTPQAVVAPRPSATPVMPPRTPAPGETGEDAPAPLADGQPAPTTTQALPPGFRPKPNPDDFSTYAEYEESLVDWKIDLREATKAHQVAQTAASQQIKATMDAFTARREQAEVEYPDYDDVVTDTPIPVDDPRKLQDLERLVVEARSRDGQPIGPDVLYHLGKNPEALAHILEAPDPVQLAMRVGEVTRDVELARTAASKPSAPAPTPPKVSNAPRPVRPVSGATAVATSELDDSLPFAEWEKRRQAQIRAAETVNGRR